MSSYFHSHVNVKEHRGHSLAIANGDGDGAGAGAGVIGYFHFFRGGESNSFQGKRRRDQSSLTEHIKN